LGTLCTRHVKYEKNTTFTTFSEKNPYRLALYHIRKKNPFQPFSLALGSDVYESAE